ncbi:ABC transporter substrate-binding protein [Mesorhizobium sp. RIZ17]|uniref:ABC transporter substrate-binding protein n=1 Tax=Mesorhizobium sp. RIZ17 TaxID=3132743 RepID=UPI003DA906AE
MSQELDYLSRPVVAGRLSRRDFLGHATVLGVSAMSANSILTSAARAQGPVRGGIIKGGLTGGGSTDILDPATSSELVSIFGSCWGEYLVALAPDSGLENRLAEEVGSPKEGKTWTMKIRKGVEFHSGKIVTAQDVVATLERHSDGKSHSGRLACLRALTPSRRKACD